jgi:hypothetical protein
MSKIALQGDASGTGTFTIASPNSNTDRTLTLPDEAGTVLTSGGAIADALNVDSAPTNSLEVDGSSNLKFNSGYGSVATAYGCRAWVNFSGENTPTIRDDGNVSSITDTDVGKYRINFSNSMPDTTYCAVGTDNQWGNVHLNVFNTSYVEIRTRDSSFSTVDASTACVAVFR